MKAAIENIIIKERIRKEVTKISELAEDIRRNGLINPVTVMPLDDEAYQLLAGLRRVRAVQSLGVMEIEVKIVLPDDAEAALKIEISENEQREPFTFSEKMDYGRLLEEIEKAKAHERQVESGSKYGRGVQQKVEFPGTQSIPKRNPQVRDIVGEKINMSGSTYERAKYIADNAPPEVIDKLDKGELTIRKTYDELRAKEKASEQPVDDISEAVESDEDEEEDHSEAAQPKEGTTKGLFLRPIPQPKTPLTRKREPALPSANMTEEELMSHFSEADRENLRRIKEFKALPPEGKIKALEQQLFDMRVKANAALSELDRLKYEYGIKVDHKDSIIDSLKRQVARLNEMLETADKRIAELEGKEQTDAVQDAAII